MHCRPVKRCHSMMQGRLCTESTMPPASDWPGMPVKRRRQRFLITWHGGMVGWLVELVLNSSTHQHRGISSATERRCLSFGPGKRRSLTTTKHTSAEGRLSACFTSLSGFSSIRVVSAQAYSLSTMTTLMVCAVSDPKGPRCR